MVKLILNLILVPIPEIGVNGAAWASVACHVVAFSIAITSLIKHFKIKFNIKKFVVKPIIATIMMALCSKFAYNILVGILPGRLATIVTLVIAIIIYVLAIVALRVFTKKEILSLPMGSKICKILEKTKIY
ncbi:MAG: polysaccharide biosynthesis C-terminal domain-containing protein [Clostridia bacterium]|nr:polysaccharide biosynthesis C-terminal domain-containing protein [Clostridia bacterium]